MVRMCFSLQLTIKFDLHKIIKKTAVYQMYPSYVTILAVQIELV